MVLGVVFNLQETGPMDAHFLPHDLSHRLAYDCFEALKATNDPSPTLEVTPLCDQDVFFRTVRIIVGYNDPLFEKLNNLFTCCQFFFL